MYQYILTGSVISFSLIICSMLQLSKDSVPIKLYELIDKPDHYLFVTEIVTLIAPVLFCPVFQ